MTSRAPQLLNEDGRASLATTLMMSHHAFRRDAAQLAVALGTIGDGDRKRAAEAQAEWTHFREALRGHHEHEDQRTFPTMLADHPGLASLVEQLGEEHKLIEPLLTRGDRAFRELRLAEAVPLMADLTSLLHPHLAAEEEHLIPYLRDAREFPQIGEAELEMFAQGFAWASYGVHPHVLERVNAMLPPALLARMPAAAGAFREKYHRTWGKTGDGASRTSVPDWLAGGG
jgi:hypothetical protein